MKSKKQKRQTPNFWTKKHKKDREFSLSFLYKKAKKTIDNEKKREYNQVNKFRGKIMMTVISAIFFFYFSAVFFYCAPFAMQKLPVRR